MPANYQVMYIDMLNYFVYFEQERTARMVSAFLFFGVLTKRRGQAPTLLCVLSSLCLAAKHSTDPVNNYEL